MDIINSPWTIGVGVTVIGGLILHYVFGIGKTSKKINRDGGQGGGVKAIGQNNIFGGGGGGPAVQEIQKRKWEENEKNQFKNSAK